MDLNGKWLIAGFWVFLIFTSEPRPTADVKVEIFPVFVLPGQGAAKLGETICWGVREIAVSCMQIPGHRVQPSLVKEVRIPWLSRVNRSTSHACDVPYNDASSLGREKARRGYAWSKGLKGGRVRRLNKPFYLLWPPRPTPATRGESLLCHPGPCFSISQPGPPGSFFCFDSCRRKAALPGRQRPLSPPACLSACAPSLLGWPPGASLWSPPSRSSSPPSSCPCGRSALLLIARQPGIVAAWEPAWVGVPRPPG